MAETEAPFQRVQGQVVIDAELIASGQFTSRCGFVNIPGGWDSVLRLLLSAVQQVHQQIVNDLAPKPQVEIVGALPPHLRGGHMQKDR